MAMWAKELGLLDHSALNGALPFADVAKQAEIALKTIDSPFGEITYLPTLLEMTDIKPNFIRGPQPLGSSKLSW